MNPNDSSENLKQSVRGKFVLILLVGGCFLALLLIWLPKVNPPVAPATPSAEASLNGISGDRKNRPAFSHRSNSHGKQTAEEKVAARLVAFDKNRREVTHRYAEKLGIEVPDDFEKFFDAAEKGDWDEINRLYKELQKKRMSLRGEEAVNFQKFLPAAQEAWGAHEAAHSWSAQALLDYGRDVLGSLRSDMVYVGGTDPGRFIPTFLNETSGSENHIVLTQNALADGNYLNYVNFLYGDRLKTLTGEDSQSAFNEYLQGAAQRFAEGKLLPDENYKAEEGRVQVSGTVAVMAINELLLKKLQEKNPELSFGLEESFSLPSTYSGAVPLGPILELKPNSSNPQLTTALAANSLDYWRDKVGQLNTASEPTSPPTSLAYAHMIVAQGNLFSSQNFSTEAEQAYRLAQQLGADSVEPTSKLYDLLRRNGRTTEADKILIQFQQTYPEKVEAMQKLINPKR
ncbi:MAG: hypothetical protein ABI042_06760 [Verrucomicrobiota bacterium]